MRKPSIFAELLKAIMLEVMFNGYGGGSLDDRREMWRRLCVHTGAR